MTQNTHQKEVLVYAHWLGLDTPFLMGTLNINITRGKEIFSFEYNDKWLQSGIAQDLDPDMGLYSGPQYLRDEKANFGLFMDSSPDRWGRLLMRRREAALARKEGREVNTLHESDYLLGVFDEYRMGALRFKTDPNGEFLNNNKKFASPSWTSLRDLEYASLQLEKDDISEDPEYFTWLSMLLAPGSSLGGARPKASVVDPNGELWIAKFPSLNDHKNVGAWEMIINRLAIKAGLNVAYARAQKFYGNHHTFITKRFDRNTKGHRIHFASALTMLGYKDGTDNTDGVGYLELAEFLIQKGARVNEDLEELWRRIVFYICVSNTDDHLRNHGFILTDNGWILSPAYDINPIETGSGLSLNITEDDNSLDLKLALEIAEYFRLNNKRANEIIKQIKESIQHWREISIEYGIPKTEQDLMSRAFSKAY
ncbi:MAG: HipA domain-containing protein [Bacteroidetes bacterium]|nr:HipA domain-containing protein [Bacteroidota bacterium]